MKEQLSDQGLLKTQAFINGHWIDAHDGATIDVTNPATGEVLASVAKVGAAETAQAIEAAEKAVCDFVTDDAGQKTSCVSKRRAR